MFAGATNVRIQYELAAASTVECFAFLGWLRGGETFGLDEEAMEFTPGERRPEHGLRLGIGVLSLLLDKATKSSQDRQADIIIAVATFAGVNARQWYTRLLTAHRTLGYARGALFRHHDGRRWTSHHFRISYLYPLLHGQQTAGEPFLAALDGSPRNTIEDQFYNIHSCRRGGRTTATRGDSSFRAADPTEVVGHGRWRARSFQDMQVHYNEWRIPERIRITLLCM